MKDKGFLIRGTLKPGMGTSAVQNRSLGRVTGKVPVGTPISHTAHRIPSSISLKRNPGQRG